jgi:hypothetical protein
VSKTIQRVTLFPLLSLLFSFFCLDGCVSPGPKVHPEFETRVQQITKPVLMPPDVKVFEALAGGLVVSRDDWSAAGRENLKNAIVNGFSEKNCIVKPLDLTIEITEELQEIQSLYKVVNKSIRLQACGSQISSDGKRFIDYSVGSLESILSKLDADAMMFVCGLEEVSKAKTRAVINLAVADPSGAIIWYAVQGSRGKHDLTNSKSTAELVEKLIVSFPKVGI